MQTIYEVERIINVFDDFLKEKGISFNEGYEIVSTLSSEDKLSLSSQITDIMSTLTPGFKESIYRERELEYRTEDARLHLEERLESNYDDDYIKETLEGLLNSEDELKEVATQFIDSYDCNLSENEQWNVLIDSYLGY